MPTMAPRKRRGVLAVALERVMSREYRSGYLFSIRIDALLHVWFKKMPASLPLVSVFCRTVVTSTVPPNPHFPPKYERIVCSAQQRDQNRQLSIA
jgi:hypothetical protein